MSAHIGEPGSGYIWQQTEVSVYAITPNSQSYAFISASSSAQTQLDLTASGAAGDKGLV